MTKKLRLLPALAIVSSVVLLAGCSGSGTEVLDSGTGTVAGMGSVTIRVHDQADPTLQEVHVTFSSLSVRSTDGEWIDLEPTGEDIDLLAHVGEENAVTVATGLVPEGEYDRARATVAAVRAVLTDQTSTDVPLPEGGQQVETTIPFEVGEGGEVTVNLHFPVEGSLQIVGTDVTYTPTVEASVAATN